MRSVLGLCSWAAARTWRSPAAWLGATLVLGLWALTEVLGPLAMGGRFGSNSGATYEIAFLAALLGTLLAGAALPSAEWVLELGPRSRRTGLKLSVLLAGGTAALLLGGWLPARLLGADPSQDPGAWDSILGLLHLAALALWIDRLPLPGPLRSLALPLVAWLVPSAVGADDALGRLLDGLANASRHWTRGVPDGPAALASALPVLGLLGAIALLDSAPPRATGGTEARESAAPRAARPPTP